jgi:hypothetical protein
MTTPLTALGSRVVSYAIGAYKGFIESVVVETSKRNNWIGKLKRLVPFLIVESDWMASSPLSPRISLNTINKNFETAILFHVVERARNYVFEDDNPLTALSSRVVIYTLGHIRFL